MRKRSWPAVSHCDCPVSPSHVPQTSPDGAFLSCGGIYSTHNLKFHSLAVKLDGPDLEVDADGGDVALGVGVVREAEQQA